MASGWKITPESAAGRSAPALHHPASVTGIPGRIRSRSANRPVPPFPDTRPACFRRHLLSPAKAVWSTRSLCGRCFPSFDCSPRSLQYRQFARHRVCAKVIGWWTRAGIPFSATKSPV